MIQRLWVQCNDYLYFNDLKLDWAVNLQIFSPEKFSKADFMYKIAVIPLYQNDGYSLANNPNFDTKSLFVAPFAETVSLFTVVITILF